MTNLLISFYGDDFTGSTDATESLCLAGVKTVLFTAAPTPAQLTRYPGLRAFGVAGMTRSQPPALMEQSLRPAFEAMRQTGAPIVHYKVCSTFDSSPAVGSIGKAIDVGADVFAQHCVPMVVGAPSLGRYCVFGNLFARAGAESEVFRLDRHPSMSRHPVTPMNEADLRLHLSKQTRRSIGLVDSTHLSRSRQQLIDFYDDQSSQSATLLIDLMRDDQLEAVGALLARDVKTDQSHFVVGSSGVGEALCAHWRASGQLNGSCALTPAAAAKGPIIVLCGSCSPVTAKQIEHAVQNGFVEVKVNVVSSIEAVKSVSTAAAALRDGRSVVLHTAGATLPDARLAPAAAGGIGPRLGRVLRELLAAAPVRRVIIAGGDTSGQIAHALEIESMEVAATATRGAPLMNIAAPGSPADGIEMIFKGGQIGAVDFFVRARDGF
jgi:uncharacterized protein YgbK (DUF1537 family)